MRETAKVKLNGRDLGAVWVRHRCSGCARRDAAPKENTLIALKSPTYRQIGCYLGRQGTPLAQVLRHPNIVTDIRYQPFDASK
ncbi:MAG: hypothetical protein IPO07_15845 [Haliscomenobacter sp.]|nr:hypothetical protein [Haliscomenobacter sp.]MBK9490073.1 hypothetical protein [Haliscomenobacter sp.]